MSSQPTQPTQPTQPLSSGPSLPAAASHATAARASTGAKPAQTRTKPHGKPVLRVCHPHAAGLDIGAEEIYAALPQDRAAETVRCFGTFTEDLWELTAWLKEHGITSVAMESTGVYWIPLYQILEQTGIEVYLVNARHVKNVPGRKTDVQDCQWLQYLHSVGLLSGSFRPAAAVCELRSVLRHRESIVTEGARHIHRMQKALDQMNVKLHHVLSDLSGLSGLAIVDAILAGERNPKVLVRLCHRNVKASEEQVIKALIGDYRREHLFTLRQARAAYQFSRQQLAECDREIEQYLRQLATEADPNEVPPPKPKRSSPRKGKAEIILPEGSLHTELYRIYGVDLTQMPGLDVSNLCALLSELGPELQPAFPSADHFVSWQGLCPNPQKSGGKVLRHGTREVKSRVATIFRVAAQTLHRSKSALGTFYRRMRAKLGAPKAVTATAHKLARIFYHLVTTKTAYDESVFAANEELHQKRRQARLEREAAEMGYVLTLAT